MTQAVRYNGYFDLFRKWLAGADELEPAKGAWGLRVHDGELLRGLDEVVGMRVEKNPRAFWYLVTAFRQRFAFRARLEDYGGIPCMPFELAYVVHEARGQRYDPGDMHVSDGDAFSFLGQWVGFLPRKKRDGVYWRGHRIQAEGHELKLSHTVHKETRVVLIAKYQKDVLYLLGQARRSPPVLWVRDALYVQLGRKPSPLDVRRLGSAGHWKPLSDEIRIRNIPPSKFPG